MGLKPENIPNFRLVTNPENLNIESVSLLLEKAGMRRRELEQMSIAVRNSTEVVAAFLQSGALIGFGRLISDGVFYGTIWDVAVDPAYQGLGIGTAIMNALLKTSGRLGLYMIGLFTEQHNWAFYERLGFVVMQGVNAMYLHMQPSSPRHATEEPHER